MLVFIGMIFLPESLMVRPRAPVKAAVEGAVGFDLCTAWEQIGGLIRLSALIWSATFLYLLVQGLRNRTVPRVIAIISIVASAPSVRNQLWRVQHCQSNLGIALFWVWIMVVGLMCVHHIIQRPVRA